MSFDGADLTEHLDDLYGYALRITRDPDLAADTVQDTVVRALECRQQYRADAPLRNWLMRIAHNSIVDRARRSGREVAVDDVELLWQDDTYTVEAEVLVERAATRDELLDALARVPYIYRSAVVLHDIDGLRVSDVAAIHEISLSAAKQRLRRGRMALVTALDHGPARRRAMKEVRMPCWDARQHVSEYLDGDLDQATSTMIETHLATCPTCPPLYAALVGVHDELGRLRDPDTVIATLDRDRILAVIDGLSGRPGRRPA